MLRNFLKIAFRNLWRNKAFAAINIFGLAVGMASCLLIVLYVGFELSYDNFHEQQDRIYRIKHETFKEGTLVEAKAQTFPAVGPALERDFPEVAESTRFYALECDAAATDGAGQQTALKENKVYFVDEAFLNVFSFPLLQGAVADMQEPNAALITQSTARKYFGDENPVGKSIKLENHNQGLLLNATVRGVCQDIPANSHLQFDFLVSAVRGEGSWHYADHHTYVVLQPGAKAEALEAKLPAFINKYTGKQPEERVSQVSLSLQPLQSIHLYSDLKGELSRNGDGTLVWILAFSAFLILLIAYVNYINLSTAKSVERAKEVGVRKVLGSERLHLMKQFFLEALLYKLLSVIVAMLLLFLSFDWFKQISGVTPALDSFNHWGYWLAFLGIFVMGAAGAGFYPALLMSSFKPVQALKGQALKGGSGMGFRKALVVFQFAVSMLLMIGAFTVYKQVNYMRNKDLGMDMTQTLVVAAPEYRRESQEEEALFYQKISLFKEEVSQYVGVSSLTFTSGIPGAEINWVRPYRRKSGDAAAKEESLYATMSVGPEFVDQLEVKVVEGEAFSMEKALSLYQSTSRIPIMLNEAAVAAMGFENSKAAIGQIITDKNGMGRVFEYEIMGILQNFHQSSLKTAYEPLVFRLEDGSGMKYFVIKISGDRSSEVISQLEKTYNTLFPATAYQYFFLDEFFNQQYLAEQQFGLVFGIFTGLAIFVACLGLLGLMLLATTQRAKEIAIRKVIGASPASLFVLLTKDFSRLILIAMLISLPLAWWGIREWLQHYAFHIDIDPYLFLIPALMVVAVALLFVSLLIVKTSRAKPVGALRGG